MAETLKVLKIAANGMFSNFPAFPAFFDFLGFSSSCSEENFEVFRRIEKFIRRRDAISNLGDLHNFENPMLLEPERKVENKVLRVRK